MQVRKVWLEAQLGIAVGHKQTQFSNGPELSKSKARDFPGGPVVKTPSSQCRGPRFDPWSVN